MINIFFLQLIHFIFSILLFSYYPSLSSNVNNKSENFIEENEKLTKKSRKVDISTLREEIAHEFILLLKEVEKALKKCLINIKKSTYIELSEQIMDIFHWVNECIEEFDENITEIERDQLESYLNQAQKYKVFLKSIYKEK